MGKAAMFVWIFLIGNLIFAADNIVVPLPEINRPDNIWVENGSIYIAEGAVVYIYSMEDFKLKGSFGKRGEGPRELLPYRLGLLLNFQDGNIFISSLGKVSLFSGKGDYIREIKAARGKELRPWGDVFVGWEFVQEGMTTFRKMSIFDAKLNEVREIFRIKHSVQEGRGFKIFSASLIFNICRDKMYVCCGEEFKIDIYNKNRKEYSITREYERIKITDYHKQSVLEFFKNDRRYKNDYEVIKSVIEFPDYFPAVRTFFVADNKIYVRTYRSTRKEAEFFIFDLNGKLLKRVLLPIAAMNPNVQFLSYPYTIKNQKIFELIEDVAREEWKLRITAIPDR